MKRWEWHTEDTAGTLPLPIAGGGLLIIRSALLSNKPRTTAHSSDNIQMMKPGEEGKKLLWDDGRNTWDGKGPGDEVHTMTIEYCTCSGYEER